MRLLAVLLPLIAASAFAEDAAQAYLRAANMLYQKLEYEKALDQLDRARKTAVGIEDDVQIALWEGILLAELGRMDDARTAFNTALALNSDAKLPVKVSPKVTAEFEKLRVAAKKELARTTPVTPPPRVAPVPAPAPVVVASVLPPPTPIPEIVEAPRQSGGARRFAPIPFAIAGAGAVAAVVGGVVGANAAGKLRSATLSLEDAQQVRERGSTFQIIGFVGLGVGVAGLVTGSLMMLLGAPSSSTLTLAPIDGGAAVGLRINLP